MSHILLEVGGSLFALLFLARWAPLVVVFNIMFGAYAVYHDGWLSSLLVIGSVVPVSIVLLYIHSRFGGAKDTPAPLGGSHAVEAMMLGDSAASPLVRGSARRLRRMGVPASAAAEISKIFES